MDILRVGHGRPKPKKYKLDDLTTASSFNLKDNILKDVRVVRISNFDTAEDINGEKFIYHFKINGKELKFSKTVSFWEKEEYIKKFCKQEHIPINVVRERLVAKIYGDILSKEIGRYIFQAFMTEHELRLQTKNGYK